ncbi:unnamed protein product [Camellia sinensis]
MAARRTNPNFPNFFFNGRFFNNTFTTATPDPITTVGSHFSSHQSKPVASCAIARVSQVRANTHPRAAHGASSSAAEKMMMQKFTLKLQRISSTLLSKKMISAVASRSLARACPACASALSCAALADSSALRHAAFSTFARPNTPPPKSPSTDLRQSDHSRSLSLGLGGREVREPKASSIHAG